MSGRSEFETIVAAAPRERLVSFEQVNSTGLAVSGLESTSFFAPENTVVQLFGILLLSAKPTGASSGQHEFYMSYSSPNIDIVHGISAFGADLSYTAGMWVSATLTKQPDTTEAALLAVVNTRFDSVKPLIVTYANYSNVAQTNTRTIRLWGIARTVG
jgi:hypothetical protein